LVLIWAAAGLAATALSIFNKSRQRAPEATDNAVRSLRQSAGVLGSIVAAIVAVIDALTAFRKVGPAMVPSQQPSGGGGHPKLFGVTPAVDVTPPA
jgi:hypothetical protein